MEDYSIKEWFERYEKDVTSFLVYYTSSTDVEDLVQDTFLHAIKSLSKFKGNSSPKTWLISIARNIVTDRYRKKHLWERIKKALIPEQSYDKTTEMMAIKKWENHSIHHAIQQLAPQYREVVILRGILELSPDETSIVLNCNKNNVNVMYHRSLKKLKMILEKEGFCYEGYRRH
ncbi:RNA polymerase sigma factor [Bacillus spongiae]|uniref:RNA polymerase sigma factor n=1 Tax=Bacillus spongiae TaxID=2683610 RepID=A0ABU8HF94_9BACI